MGSVALASCQSDGSRVCAARQDSIDDTWLAVLRSDNGGLTWQIPYADPTLQFFKPGGSIDMGFDAARTMDLGVHPLHPDMILLASRRSGILGSTDAGVTWDKDHWPVISDDSFHGDSLCLEFDPADPTGNTVIVGNDGGVFVSHDAGVSWDTSYNEFLPTLMFDQATQPSAPALSASSAYPGFLVGALQDNGNVYLSAPGHSGSTFVVPQQPWQQLFDGGDGNRALFLTPDIVMRGGNDSLDLKWARWDGTRWGDPVAFKPLGYPGLYLPKIADVPYPQYRDPDSGAFILAIAGDEASLAGDVYGLFDWGQVIAQHRNASIGKNWVMFQPW
jgi:hypothetical protein